MLGLPGGQDSPYFEAIREEARNSPGGMKLMVGKGNEPDTLGAKVRSQPYHPS